MRSYRIEAISAMAALRHKGYLEEVMRVGIVADGRVSLSDADFARIREEFTPIRPRIEWPLWAVVVSLFASGTDTGLGDTLRRELGGPKSPRFKAWHESVFGIWAEPCGCGKLAHWNTLYPYAKPGPLTPR